MARNRLRNLTARAQESAVADDKYKVNEEDTPLIDVVNELKNTASFEVTMEDAEILMPYPDKGIRLQLHTGYKRDTLKESIQHDGIIEPCIIWLKEGEKIILAGHNRVDIAKELHMKVPCIIRTDLDTKKAERIVIITNLQNRQINEMKSSELSRMLTRLIEGYDDSVYKSEIYKDIDDEFSLSRTKVLWYLKINSLNTYLLEMLDNDDMPLTAAYKLACATSYNQNKLADFIRRKEIKKVSITDAEKLAMRKTTDWDEEFMMVIFGLIEKAKKPRKTTTVSVRLKDIEKYAIGEQVTASGIIGAYKFKNDIKSRFEESGYKYNEETALKAVEEYLKKSKKGLIKSI